MKRLRVVYILNSSMKHGGASKSLLYMLEGLLNKNIIPLIVIPNKGDLCDEFDKRNITYKFIPSFLSVYPSFNCIRDVFLWMPRIFRTLIVNYIAELKLTRLVDEFKPDIIHTNVGPIYFGYIVSKRKKIPHVWHLREYQNLDFGIHPLFSMRDFKRKLRYSNNYPIAITRDIYNYFSLTDKAKIVYNGILKVFDTQFISKKENYFLFVGRLELAKGINNLIIAFADFVSIARFDFKLYIVGDTPDIKYKKKVLKQIEIFGIEEKVLFLGLRDDVNELMAKATALIVPSIFEGFGRITVEAMFNGCLVIGNKTGGTKEILEKEQLGILYSGSEELVTSMTEVVSNGIAHYYPIIKKAQERAVSLYSIEQNVSAVYDLYIEILNRSKQK